jgi:cytochrome c biogenesis protein
MRLAKTLASLRLTLLGMLALALLAIVAPRSSIVSIDMTVVPLGLLSINLLAALMTNRTLRTQTGLLVFHVGLLLVFACIGLSVLTRFDGHVEIVQGSGFDAAIVETRAEGWLHEDKLARIEFYQSDIRVDYLPGLRRQETRSIVEYRGEDGAMHRATVGDKVGFEVDGYRFLATFNKGFALVLHWQGESGAEAVGAVNFLSFPRHDWNQVTTWTTPAGQEVELEIDFDEPYFDDNSAWTLQETNVPYRVNVTPVEQATVAAREGAALKLRGGTEAPCASPICGSGWGIASITCHSCRGCSLPPCSR